jgi:hypothetical protein
MTGARIIELAAAVVIFGLGVWLYRRRPKHQGPTDQGYGSQSAVLLFALAAIMTIHALGALDYHPSAAEIDAVRAQ